MAQPVKGRSIFGLGRDLTVLECKPCIRLVAISAEPASHLVGLQLTTLRSRVPCPEPASYPLEEEILPRYIWTGKATFLWISSLQRYPPEFGPVKPPQITWPSFLKKIFLHTYPIWCFLSILLLSIAAEWSLFMTGQSVLLSQDGQRRFFPHSCKILKYCNLGRQI